MLLMPWLKGPTGCAGPTASGKAQVHAIFLAGERWERVMMLMLLVVGWWWCILFNSYRFHSQNKHGNRLQLTVHPWPFLHFTPAVDSNASLLKRPCCVVVNDSE